MSGLESTSAAYSGILLRQWLLRHLGLEEQTRNHPAHEPRQQTSSQLYRLESRCGRWLRDRPASSNSFRPPRFLLLRMTMSLLTSTCGICVMHMHRKRWGSSLRPSHLFGVDIERTSEGSHVDFVELQGFGTASQLWKR